MTAAIEFRGVSRVFGEVRAVDDVSFAIEPGEFFAMLGPSGSGKTSCLRLVAGFDTPDRGQVLLDGADVLTLTPREARRRIALVAQAPAMFQGTVLDNVRTGPRLAGQELPEADARALIVRAGLEPQFLGQDARALSGGEKLRVAVARALALHPEVWLLDEPTAALDVERAGLLVRLLRELAAAGAALLVVTHDARVLDQLAGTHLQLAGGRLTAEKPA